MAEVYTDITEALDAIADSQDEGQFQNILREASSVIRVLRNGRSHWLQRTMLLEEKIREHRKEIGKWPEPPEDADEVLWEVLDED